LRAIHAQIPRGCLAVAVLACLISDAVAADVHLALFELATKQTKFYDLDLESGQVQPAAKADGATLPDSAKYNVQDYKVKGLSGAPLAEAIEILCQVSLGEHDLIVVRQEYNSANPLYWLAAMSGHPVQVSKIVWLDVKGGKLVHSVEIDRQPASYHWQASLSLPN